MDEIERQAANEALQREHRLAMQKQAGVRPEDDDKVVKSLRDKTAEKDAARAEELGGPLPIIEELSEEVAPVEEQENQDFSIDQYEPEGPRESYEQPQPDQPPLDEPPENYEPVNQTTAVSPTMGDIADSLSPAADDMSKSVMSQPEPRRPDVIVDSEKAKKADTPTVPNRTQQKKLDRRKGLENQAEFKQKKQAQAQAAQAQYVSQVKQHLLQSRQNQFGGYGQNTYGGQLPHSAPGTSNDSLSELYQSYADANESFAVGVADALERMTRVLLYQSERIRALEYIIDEATT